MKFSGSVVLGLFLLQLSVASGRRLQTQSPVEKVVNLLKDLKTKLEADSKTEGQVYDKYACWCEKTSARKAEAISAAQDELRELGQSMLKLKGQVATLVAEITELSENMAANREAQADATSIRQKENAAFMAETTEMKEVLNALERAIIVLREGTKPSSFLQQGSAGRAALKAVVDSLPPSANIKPEHLSLLGSLVGGSAKYAPQSWTVQGILGDMYDTFSADLESATVTEATKNKNFENFIADKTKELNAMADEKLKKEGEKADAEELLADRTQSYDDTEAQMKADIAFFDETKAACDSKHSEWVTRKELRAEELEGVKKALAILTTDSARELFSSAIKAGKEVRADDSYDTGVSIASFLQVSDEGSESAPASRAYSALKDSATSTKSLRLAALAVSVREAKVGHFDQVLAAIGAMMKTLRDEDAADIAKRDQCKEEYKKVNSTIANVQWLIKKNQAAIDKLERLIESLNDEKAKTIEAIKEVEAQMAAMTQQRKDENQAFKNAKKEDQDAIDLLVQARTVLAAYYKKHSIDMGPIQGSVKGLAFAQQGPDFDVSADQAPEAVFSGKGKRKDESKGIVQLMTMIIEDLNDEIKNGMKSEELAQLEYEKQMKAANKLKDELTEKKINLIDMIDKRTDEKGQEEVDMANNKADLKDEQDYKAQITPDCDWILGAFVHRAEQRAAEMAGLVKAKEFLAGYQPSESALLDKQHLPAFDDTALARVQFRGLRQ